MRALDSTATDGSGKTGLAFGDITAKYLTQGGTLTSLTTETITTLGTYQAPTSAAHIRIKELAGSNPTLGVYEVHFHNTQMVDTGKRLWLFCSASGAVFQPLEVDLKDSVAQTGDSYAIVNSGVIGNGQIVTLIDAVGTLVADVPTTSEFNARTLPAADYFDPAADPVATVTTLTNKTGFSLASTGLDLCLVDGYSILVAMSFIAATTAGRLTGAGTNTETFKGLDETTTRVVVTSDSSGNRSDIAYTP